MSLALAKIGAIAATALMISATGAFAATLSGEIKFDTKVKANHSNGSPTLQWAEEGQHVTILNAWGSWWYVKLPGPDGWVKKNAVYIDYDDYDDEPGPGVKFCFNGPFGYFCASN